MFKSNSLLRNKLFLFFVFIAFFVSFYFPAAAEPNKSDDVTGTANKTETGNINPDNQKGLKVYIDPDTGELVSEPLDDEATSIESNNSIFGGSDEVVVDQPVEIIHPDGSATIIMPESMQHSTMVKIDENGNQITECNRKHEHDHE